MTVDDSQTVLHSGSHVVVIGAGHAGVQFAAAARELGFDGQVTLLNGDGCEPYERPILSKDFLKSADRLPTFLRSDAYYTDTDIGLLRAEVAGVDTTRREVHTEDGRTWTYDHLVFATGGRPRVLEVPNRNLPGIVTLRTLEDAEELRARLASSRRVVVVGGGFIGLEVAAAAVAQQKTVVVVEAMDRLMARVMSEEPSRAALDHHRSSGAEVLLGRQVTAFEGVDHVTGVCLDNGRLIPADLVVVGVGMEANDEIARSAGLATDRGIVVDCDLRASDPHVSAIGDCSVVTIKDTGSARRLESIANANSQARRVAEQLVGHPSSGEPVPWFWSHQGSLKLQIVGFPDPSNDHVIAGDATKFSVLCFGDGLLRAVESVNDAGGHMAARRVLEGRHSVTRQTCQDKGFDLRRIAQHCLRASAATA
ncbi:NAD(P)/FAD-dependent oxidoreductase [Rhodococcus wratislaviensis]|uniref:NAD(P)/FAD-dependent oxidoreductase n=1 Tax=Rhodococcus wratislaviensis TaxID=44752 RepID=UPI00364F6F8D